MEKENKLNRIFYLNLFSKFILSKVGEGSIIKLIDMNNFVVVKGNIVSDTPINLFELGKEFNDTHKDLFEENIKINTIDILNYDFNSNISEFNKISGIR
jgi:hypothetical protein